MKCKRCNGCTTNTWVGNRHYNYCEFCRLYYDHLGNVYNQIQVDNFKAVDETRESNQKRKSDETA